MRVRKRDPDRSIVEDVGARLARRIRIWARFWRRCPKKGCRRARRCLRFERDCAAVSKTPYWPSETDKRRYFDPLRAALRARAGHPPPHDRGEVLAVPPAEQDE